MNIVINPNAALDDATQIDSIVSSIQAEMDQLDVVINDCIDKGPDTITTEWGTAVKTNWNNYHNEDIPAVMAEMTKSASNLRVAVDEALRFSREG